MKTANDIKLRIEWLETVSEKEGDSRVDPNFLALDEMTYLKALAKDIKKLEKAMDDAMVIADRLTKAIEDMKLDCDVEVYEGLCDIWRVLNI